VARLRVASVITPAMIECPVRIVASF